MKSPSILVILMLLVGVFAGCAGEDGGRMDYGEETVNESTAQQEEGGEEGESGTQYGLADTAEEIRSGIELSISYDSTREVFSGTMTNTTDATIRTVRVEVHLSNGVELGPTPTVDLAAGESSEIELDAGTQTFTTFSAHVEIGSDEHGGGHSEEEGDNHP
ncbi:MAG: hypothetical protein F4058_01640 [Rhodothermaceae bacterium]|nr:FxLYD domain-containing protein [Bacteroidota bacterium]MXY08749.1 hypothetical protein [Rhodothermaceae bacterium]MYF63326.1 hypothetical protein [Rhodothermaceae bacterium]MYI84014.1 hypothetical protein [Rhodothermaceae bacterium]